MIVVSRLVDNVMTMHPYATARRVFWIGDNGSSHRGAASVNRLQSRYRNLRLLHCPIHASWLNQIEIYFSVVDRKAPPTTSPTWLPSLRDSTTSS